MPQYLYVVQGGVEGFITRQKDFVMTDGAWAVPHVCAGALRLAG